MWLEGRIGRSGKREGNLFCWKMFVMEEDLGKASWWATWSDDSAQAGGKCYCALFDSGVLQGSFWCVFRNCKESS